MRTYETASSSIVDAGGPCTESSGLEVRVHARFKSTAAVTYNGSNASYAAMSITPCPAGGTCSTCATGSAGGWSCEQRCESGANAGSCGNWVSNGSQNASYPGDPGYVISSNYPSNETLELQMKGFESDQYLSICFGTICNTNKPEYNFNDGACQTTCSNGSCYGNYQVPTSGRYTTVDIGAVTNTIPPFCGSNWSANYDAAYEGVNCSLDLTGYNAYYYLQWQYRWCWNATTLNDTHAGLIKFPVVPEICSGSIVTITDSSEAFEAARGYAYYQWQYTTDGSNWYNISGATAKDLSTSALTNNTINPITYTIRRAGIYCIDFAATPGYKYIYTNNQIIIVYPQPISPTLYPAGTNPANGTTICKGLFTYAQFNSGTGGYTDAQDEYQYSIDNGANWIDYTPGYSINTSAANTNVLVHVRRTAGNLSGCTETAWSTEVTWPVSTVATPPSLSSSVPNNGVSLCLPSADITGVINQGSGGSGYEYGCSITNGTTPSSITTGTIPTSSFSISTTGATTKINLFGRQTGVGVGACSPTPWALIGEWPIVAQPISPTLISKTPNQPTVMIGEDVGVTANAGTNGAADANDEYRISFDNGVNWTNYIEASNITVPNGSTTIIIQGRRNAGNTLGCTTTTWSDLASWTVDAVLPIQLISFSGYVNRENYVVLNWKTLSELNSTAYIIQKSDNALNWINIGKIDIVDNSMEEKNYAFCDSSILQKNNYYRLKIIEADNNFSFSNIINVSKMNYSIVEFNLFPNPVRNILYIKSEIPIDNCIISIVDMFGRNIIDKSYVGISTYNFQIEVNNLSKGIYFININSNNTNNISKFVKE